MSVSNHLGYRRIRRGPMAADAFTQIRNAVFRDPRLSAKAMGIFGNISTHRDGWGITPEVLSTQMRDGVNAIRSGLKELEEYGYLQRSQTRDPDTGRLGPSEYYITDQPEAVTGAPSGESGRSVPSDDSPHADAPHTGEPHTADHLHKKTNSKKTSGKKTLSPSVPEQRAEPEPAARERETDAAPTTTITTAQRVVRKARLVNAEEEAAFIAWAEARHKVQNGGWWRRVAERGDLPGIVATWRAESAPQTRAGASLPAWCQQCGPETPADVPSPARSNARWRTINGQPCDTCHPDRVAA